MTAKLTHHELRRRAHARSIARLIAFYGMVASPESLGKLLRFTDELIRVRRNGRRERFPIADSASWQTLEDLCWHRWTLMAEITRLRNDRPAA
jgi:hypothetical protein